MWRNNDPGIHVLADQHAVVQMHDAVGAGRQLQVVRHHDQTGALRAHLGEQQVEDDARRLAVEVAGRFVGEDARGRTDERPGNGGKERKLSKSTRINNIDIAALRRHEYKRRQKA